MTSNQLNPDEYAEFYGTYVRTLNDVNLIEELEISVHRLIKFVQNIPMEKFDYRYAPGKWTIKDILQHIIDTERIFAYRALRFARNDQSELPGFEEDYYADEAAGYLRSVQQLLTELAVVRQSTLYLFKTFSEKELLRSGVASGRRMSVRALGFIIIGHQNHHQQIFQERYLGQ